MPPLPERPSIRAVLLAAGALLALPGAALADGEYWGVDVSGSTIGGVLSAARGDFILGAGFTDYEGGVSASLGLSRRLELPGLPEGAQLSAGLTFGATFDDDGSFGSLAPGLGLTLQRYIPTGFGFYFLQASYDTVNQAYFAQAQVGFSEPGLLLSLSRGASTEYIDTTLAVGKDLGESPVSLRIGYRLMSEELFVGFAVNTF